MSLSQQLHEFLRGQMQSFLSTPYATPYDGPVWSLDWMPANGNNGEALLGRHARHTAHEYLDGIEAAGCRAVGIQLQYPLLDDQFPRMEEYLSFYRWAVEEARVRDMIVYAETSPAFSGTWSNIKWDYGDKADHLARRVAMACRIVQELQPDYLSVTHEPDTERAITGHALTTDDCLSLIAAVAACRDGAGVTTRIGGGLPVTAKWDALQPYGNQAGDFVTIHLYTAALMDRLQIVNGFSRLVDYAACLPLPVIVGEGGLFKAHPIELVGDPLQVASLYQRDPFQTWESLDEIAAECLDYAGMVAPIIGVNWFWSKYAFAYYTGRNPDPDNARAVATRAALRNAGRGRLTGLGEMIHKLNGQ